MVNEARILDAFGNNFDGRVISYNCAAGTEIKKGTLLKVANGRIASAAAAADDIFIGIAANDKDADDSSTTIGVYTDVIAELVSSGSITAGVNVSVEADNKVKAYTNTDLQNAAKVVGVALTNASGNKVVVRINK